MEMFCISSHAFPAVIPLNMLHTYFYTQITPPCRNAIKPGDTRSRGKLSSCIRGVQKDAVEAAGWIIQIQHFMLAQPQRCRRFCCIHLQQKGSSDLKKKKKRERNRGLDANFALLVLGGAAVT